MGPGAHIRVTRAELDRTHPCCAIPSRNRAARWEVAALAEAAGLARAPFPRYWLSSFLADFGDGIRLAAFPLLAAEVTSAPAAVAAVTAVQGLPWIAFGLGAGAVIDRQNLRTVMVAVDMARAVVIAALAVAVITGAASLALIYVAAFVTGLGSLVRDTAAATALPRLIERRDLEYANGRLITGRLIGNELAGPAAGGWLFGVAAALPFAVNAGGLGVSVLLLLTLPSVFAPRPRPSLTTGPLKTTLIDIRAGVAWLRRDRPLRALVGATSLVAGADGAYLAVLVLYVTEVLHRSPMTYGLLLGLGAVGGIAAGSGTARLVRRLGVGRIMAASMLVMAGAQLALGLTSNLIITGVALIGSGGAFAVFNVTSVSMRQRRAPAELLGRANSVYLTVGRSAEATGGLLGGGIAAFAGIQAPILAGVPLILAAAAITARSQHKT